MPEKNTSYLPFLNVEPSQALQQLASPDSRDLFWRTSSFKPLLKESWQLLAADKIDINAKEYVAENANHVVIINGQIDLKVSKTSADITIASSENNETYELAPHHYFDHLNQLVNKKIDSISIKAEKELVDLHLHYIFNAPAFAFISQYLQLTLQKNAQVNLHVHYYNLNSHSVWFNQVRKSFIKEQAKLNLFEYYHQAKALHITKHHHIHFEKKAQVEQFVLNKHFPFLYLQQHSNLEQQHSQWHISGFYILKDKQIAMYRLLADHLTKKTSSNQFMRGLLADKSKALFDSSVRVHKGCSGSESQQLNNNLLLSDYATIQSFPILEIDEDDVICSHGSTIGALDESMLFYLQSRGLSTKQSFSLMKKAFISEVIQQFSECKHSGILESYIHKDDNES